MKGKSLLNFFVALAFAFGSSTFALDNSHDSEVLGNSKLSREDVLQATLDNSHDSEVLGNSKLSREDILSDTSGDKKVYHIGICENDLEGATYAILPGDPDRVPKIAKYLENSKKIGQNREYTSYLGDCGGKKVLVMSTGIGGPSTAIAVEELAKIGIKSLIRVGTSGGIQLGVNAGDLIIAQAAVRQEGTSKEYAPIEFPAVADLDLTVALRDSAKKLKENYHLGIVQCKDSFYGQQNPKRMPVDSDLLSKWKAWIDLGVLCSEMETAALYVVSSYLRLRAGAILLSVWNQEQEALGISQDTSFDCDSAIRVAIDAISSLIKKDLEQSGKNLENNEENLKKSKERLNIIKV